MLLLPAISVLCAMLAYSILIDSSTSYNERQLREIASLMDDIYTTLANMTFIPHTAIKRGPHVINTTLIPCKHDSSVLRLMELLPYVDTFRIRNEDWIYGGQFLDYRRPDHLQESCSPLHASSPQSYMTPNTLALTTWERIGWPWSSEDMLALLYDTSRNDLRVFDGKDWITQDAQSNQHGGRFSGLLGGMNEKRALQNTNKQSSSEDRMVWFDAPTLLRQIIQAAVTLSWTPWDTHQHKSKSGIELSVIRYLLLKNGWPLSFDSDQFNVDFIRAQHRPSSHGDAQAAHKRIEELEGKAATEDAPEELGYIYHAKDRLSQRQQALEEATDDGERWLFKWRVQESQWSLENQEAELSAAKQEAAKLCPHGVCLKTEDIILWESKSLRREWETVQYLNQTEKCKPTLDESAPPHADRYENCLAQLDQEKLWLFLAYTQSNAEATQHCIATSCTPLPFLTLEERARAKIAELEHEIALNEIEIWKMVAWRETIPEYATQALQEFAMKDSAVVNRPWYIRDEIEWIEGQLKDGGDKYKLARWLEDEERAE